MILRFLQDESGATAIEYSLLAALMAIVFITAARSVGTKMDSMYQTISSSLP